MLLNEIREMSGLMINEGFFSNMEGNRARRKLFYILSKEPKEDWEHLIYMFMAKNMKFYENQIDKIKHNKSFEQDFTNEREIQDAISAVEDRRTYFTDLLKKVEQVKLDNAGSKNIADTIRIRTGNLISGKMDYDFAHACARLLNNYKIALERHKKNFVPKEYRSAMKKEVSELLKEKQKLNKFVKFANPYTNKNDLAKVKERLIEIEKLISNKTRENVGSVIKDLPAKNTESARDRINNLFNI